MTGPYTPLSQAGDAPDAAPAAVTRVQNAPGQDSRFKLLEDAIKNGDKLIVVDPLLAGMMGLAKPGEVQVTMGVDAQNKGQIIIRTPEKPDGTPRQQTVVGNLSDQDIKTLAGIMSQAKRSDLPTVDTEKLQKPPIVPSTVILEGALKSYIDTALREKTRCKEDPKQNIFCP